MTSARAIAAEFGVTTADEMPPRPRARDVADDGPQISAPVADEPDDIQTALRAPVRLEYVDETPNRPRRNDVERAAEDGLGFHWVTVLSVDRSRPRAWGDNRGELPIWVEANADWRESGEKFDQQQPSVRAIRLRVLGVRSRARALRLKDEIEEALCGRNAERMRWRFRDGIDLGGIDEWWGPFIQDVAMRCELQDTAFEIYTREEHEGLIRSAVARMAGLR